MRIEIDPADLAPLVETIVKEVLGQLGTVDVGEKRMAYPESEAAELLGMAVHQLRDRRLEGAVKAKKIGRGWYYSRASLMRLIAK